MFTEAAGSTTDACSNAESCGLQRVDDMRSIEALGNDVEEYVEQLTDMCGNWGRAIDEVRSQVGKQRQYFARDQIVSTVNDDRASRRTVDREFETMINNNVAIKHNIAASAIKETGGESWNADLVRLTNIDALTNHMYLLADAADDMAQLDDPLTRAFYGLFLTEYTARISMKSLDIDAPDVLRQVFDPATLSDLPETLQKLAIIDIRRGPTGSILLSNAARSIPDNRGGAEVFADYISANHLPDTIRQHLRSISLGAKAMGAPACPYNSIGICTKVLSKIQPGDLPDMIAADMQLRESKSTTDRVGRLTQFGRGGELSRLFDSSLSFSVKLPGQNEIKQNKRRPTVVPVEKKDLNVIETGEIIPSFSHFVLRIANDDRDTVEPVDVADLDAVGAEIGELMGHKMIMNYILNTSESVKLTEFFAKALSMIVVSPRYGQTGGAIVPLVALRSKSMMNSDGVKETYSRLSGAQADGLGGSAIARNTRIYFSQGTSNGVRYVTIHRVGHKADFVKYNARKLA
jgi:hypothetical protein